MSKRKELLERIRDLPDDELAHALGEARDQLFRLRLGHYTNQVEDALSLRYKRREVAQILTVMRRREMGLETQALRAKEEGAAQGSASEGKDE